MNVAVVTSTIGLWTGVLKPRRCILAVAILYFWSQFTEGIHQVFSQTSIQSEWSRPLLVSRQTAGLRSFSVGFMFQKLPPGADAGCEVCQQPADCSSYLTQQHFLSLNKTHLISDIRQKSARLVLSFSSSVTDGINSRLFFVDDLS